MRKRLSLSSVHLSILSAAVSVIAVACSGHETPSPSTPSPSATSPSANPAPASGGATIAGTVVGGVGASAFTALASGMTVSVVGTTITSSVDGAGRFGLEHVPAGHVDLRFSGPTADARLGLDNVAEHEEIRMTVRVNGASVEVEDNHRDKPDDRVEIEGRVADVNAAARTLRVGATVVSVPAGIRIHHGATTLQLSQIVVGDRVHVQGAKNGSGVTAQDVEVENEHQGDDQGGGQDQGDDKGAGEAEVSGTIAGKSGACPTLSFSVASKPIVTNATTQYRETTCGTLANGDRVEVEGTKQSNGSILASRVKKEK